MALLVGIAPMESRRTTSSNKVMEAAAELLYAEGDDVSIADIARKAGVSSALVHAYFRSENDKRSTKDFIQSKIAATFFTSLREIMSLILESQPPGTSSTLRLVAVYNALLRTAEKYPSFTRVVITNTWELGRFGKGDRPEPSIEGPLVGMIRTVEGLVSDGIKNGELIEPPEGPAAIRRVLIGVAQTLLASLYNGQGDRNSRKLAAQTEWLRVLQIYCKPAMAKQISAMINSHVASNPAHPEH